jgi:TetR/AcrR family transcriptional regulator of autoinduction and epiphytic fitness
MTQSSKPNRTYNSSRRRLQAAQTRRLIIESARKLFYERGYASATIEAIAQEAGVASETIYAVFGNKQAILRNLVGITLVGDDEPVPLLERPFIKEAGLETDQRNLINKFAKDIYQIMSRMSPIFSLLRTTAKTDAEIAALLTRLLNERLGGMSFFVDQLNRIGPLREQALPDQARASVWALSSAEVFDLLTRDLGWSEERYIRWLSDSLVQLLLP